MKGIEVDCLETLARHPVSIRCLASTTGRDRCAVRRALERLRVQGWVEEVDEASGRRRVHRVTKQGDQVREAIDEFRDRVFDGGLHS